MDKKHVQLASLLLKEASSMFSRKVCNDFKLSDVIPNLEERRALVKEMFEENGTPEEFNPDHEYVYFYDWWLASFLASKLKKSINDKDEDRDKAVL